MIWMPQCRKTLNSTAIHGCTGNRWHIYFLTVKWWRNIHRRETSHTNVTENDCTAASDSRKYTTTASKISDQWDVKQCCVQKSRNSVEIQIINMFHCTQIYPRNKGIHQAGPTGTQNGNMEPCGHYRMHKLGQLWGNIVLTVFTLHVHSHVLSAWCKSIVWTNLHSSCQPLRLGLVWIAIEFELISFQVKLFYFCCWSNWQIGCFWTARKIYFRRC